jgi:hypothetical protein
MGRTGSPETSVLNQSTLRNNKEDGRIQSVMCILGVPTLNLGQDIDWS